MKKILHPFLFFFLLSGMAACTWEKGIPEAGYKDYPDPVGKIMLTHCAVTGCHTTDSKGACAGLDLSSWSHLFEGSKANSAVIPFRPDYSFLFYSVNTFDDLGLKLLPVMPVNANALSREDVITIRDWIAAGAPDKNGYVKFSENSDRKKIYVVNQGCDLVAVFDAESRILMRYVDVGVSAGIEVPHSITVSPDNRFWYVSFIGNSIIEKYRCTDDVKVGEVDLGNAGWHTMAISGDSRFGIAVNWETDGKVALIDLNTMSLISKYSGSGLFVSPHGCALNQDGTRAYVTAQAGNFIYRIDLTNQQLPDVTEMVLEPGDFPSAGNGQFKPHQIRYSPDYSSYYVTAEAADELRVFQASNDSLIAVIPACEDPEEMSFSLSTPYLFVASYEDAGTFAPDEGCVSIINYKTNTFLKNIYTGFQPHQLVVDDANGYVLVANRNISLSGPAPHHVSNCSGRNGYATAISLNTLEIIPDFKAELSVDPYGVAIRK